MAIWFYPGQEDYITKLNDLAAIAELLAGPAGWTPELAVVSDGARRVIQVADWFGGEGTKPAVGEYMGVGGYVTDIADAIDIRGPQGLEGDTGATGPANTLAIGTVTGGLTADATITGTAPTQTLNLVLPKGDTGGAGADGTDGTDGKEVEFQLSATHIQWRYVGDVTWIDLVALSAITGPAGEDGTNGTNGTDGTDGTDGRGIVSVIQTAGDSSPGTTDTYTITYTDATTSTFDVYNGADGAGAVTSVNTRTGTVVLTGADVGLGTVTATGSTAAAARASVGAISVTELMELFAPDKVVYPDFTHTALNIATPVVLGDPIPGTVGNTFQADYTTFVSLSFAGTMGNQYMLNSGGTWDLVSAMPDNSYRIVQIQPTTSDSGYNTFQGVLIIHRVGGSRNVVFQTPGFPLVKIGPLSNDYDYIDTQVEQILTDLDDANIGTATLTTTATDIKGAINELDARFDKVVTVADAVFNAPYASDQIILDENPTDGTLLVIAGTSGRKLSIDWAEVTEKPDYVAAGSTAELARSEIGALRKSSPDVQGTIVEDVYAITDGTVEIDPANGSIQTWTLGANRSPTYGAGFASGQSVLLMITAGAFSITWPTTTWSKVGGSGTAPALTATGATCIILWKVGSTMYGSLLGTV